MNQPLFEQRVLLTGASRGVGLATLRLLIQSGARVFGISKSLRRLEQAKARLSSDEAKHFTFFTADLATKAGLERAAHEIHQSFNSLDILIHNAGIMLHHDDGIFNEPEGILESTLELNLLAPLRLSRALLPLLRKSKHPRILNVSSGAGSLAALSEPGIASYRLSKWSLNGLTQLQAEELKGEVSVNAFDPGWVKTDLGGPLAPGTPEEAAEGLLKTLMVPWKQSGYFFKAGEKIPW